MKKMTQVYDLPTRLFHWIFTTLFSGAFLIAKIFDDESAQYPYHMMLGLVLAFIVLLRILWGLWGSPHARFSSFALRPTQLLDYFKTFFSQNAKQYLGHNPASSWAAIIMMGLALGLAITGFLMARGINKELFEDVHELLANAFLIVVIGHVTGIILHSFKHKDAIGLSMIHGKKISIGSNGYDENNKNIKSYKLIGLIFLILVGSAGIYLNKNYDQKTQTLKILGTTLELGEGEEDGKEEEE